jgi:hypothetical protein
MTLRSRGANKARLANKAARVVNRAVRAASTIRVASKAARSQGIIPRRSRTGLRACPVCRPPGFDRPGGLSYLLIGKMFFVEALPLLTR